MSPRALAFGLLSLNLPGCITLHELAGGWDIAVHRVILPDAEVAEQADSGFLVFGGETVQHSWVWRYDLEKDEFYAELDPPLLEGYAYSTDLDEPAQIMLKYEGADTPFLPEQDEDGLITLVATGITWGAVAGITVELELTRP